MVPTTQPTPVNRKLPPTLGRVAICHPHPERFVTSAHRLPAAAGTTVMLACGQDEGIEAAFDRRVDSLVIDASRIGIQGMTALSFLRRERPELAVYFAVDGPAMRPQLIPWERFA